MFLMIGILLMCIADLVRCQSQDTATRDEIQVLIDVSGSMKRNDPKNLRLDASKLLISLMPEKSIASVWLFSEKTAALAHSDSVDDAWKKQALQKTAEIHSRGLYTHIEDAIGTVLSSGFTGNGNKNLILFTDGFVDISKNIMVSADSRERILDELIPKLQQRNVKVLTIALSDQADKELLDKLAFDTGGWMETAQTAEQLQRAFLKMALKASPRENLPLAGNQFTVDGGVEEFSVLAFKKPNSAPSRLVTPEHNKFDKQTSPANAAWLETPAYDLVTVKQPGVGDWRLEAEIDPDNQVMIVTDLKMQLGELPNFLTEKESAPVKVHFTDRDKTISRADFLDLITVSVALDRQDPLAMQPVSGQPGYFAHDFNELTQGKHALKIVADGKTFKRETVREIEVVAAPVRVEKLIDRDKREVTLNMIPDSALIDVSTLAIEATINRVGKPPETHAVEAKGGLWSMKLDELAPGTATMVNFDVTAKALDGKPISPVIKPIKIDDAFFPQTVNEQAHDSGQPSQEAQPAESEHGAENREKTASAATNWLEVGGIVLGANLVLIVCGFFIFKAIKKAKADKQQQLLEKLS